MRRGEGGREGEGRGSLTSVLPSGEKGKLQDGDKRIDSSCSSGGGSGGGSISGCSGSRTGTVVKAVVEEVTAVVVNTTCHINSGLT